MRQLQAVLSLQQGKQRKFFQRRVADIGKILGGEIAGLQRKGFIGGLADALDHQQMAAGRERQPGGDVVIAIHHRCAQHQRLRRQAAAGHVLGEAGELVEVDLGRRHESTCAGMPLHEAFALQLGQSVARSHEADLVALGQLALRIHRRAGLQLAQFNAQADDLLNPLVGWKRIAYFRGHISNITRRGPALLL